MRGASLPTAEAALPISHPEPAKPFYSLGAFKLGLAAARLLPRPAARALSIAIGRVGYARSAAAREALRANLRRVTGREGAELDALCARNVAHFSTMLADYFLCVASRGQVVESLLEKWRGYENIEAALALGRGIVLVTAHLGNWELGGALLALRGLPMTVITLEEPSTELTRWRDAYRERCGIKTIAVGPGHDFAFVEMIQRLRRNEVVAMLVDRPYAGTGAPVEFFGAPTQFSTAPALLWQHTQAAVVPAFMVQTGGRGYLSFADPMLPLNSDESAAAALRRNTERVAAHFETVVRAYPEQWFNYVPVWPVDS